MVLVPSKKDLVELQHHFEPNEPVIFQEFIPHDGVLIKVYIADGQLFTFTRPSFKNRFDAMVAFNSQKMPKSFDNNGTPTLTSVLSSVINTDISMMQNQVNHDRLQDIANHLQNQLVSLVYFGSQKKKQWRMWKLKVLNVSSNVKEKIKEKKNTHFIYHNLGSDYVWIRCNIKIWINRYILCN